MRTPAKPQEVSRRRLAIPGVVVALAAASCLTPTVLADRIESRAVSAATTAGVEPRPASWQTRLDYSQVTPTVEIVLSSPGEMEETIGRGESRSRTPLQVGFARQLPEKYQGDLASSATWSVLSDSSQVASISVQSPGAARLRLALQAALPTGARIRFFGPGTEPRRYPPYQREDFARTGAHRLDAAERESGDDPRPILWSPIVDGDTVGIEIEVPAGAATSDVQLRVERLSHFPAEPSPEYRRQNGTSRAPTDDTCPLVDVACKDLPDCPRTAVARIVFTGDAGDSYVCSGTAVNTGRTETENLADPYFLTAHHCIESQSAADSMETDWFFEHVDCDGSVLSEDHSTLHFGGELLATDAQTDMSLLELRDALPAGACLSGWSATEAGLQTADSELVALHHAEGQPKKYSAGSPGDYGVALVDDLVVDILEVAWSEGHTLPGSSGAGLFAPEDDGDRPLIGVLSGSPPEECPGAGAFGRLDLFYVSHAQRSSHPMRDNQLVCRDCHDPHGSAGEGLTVGATANETCFACHAEKRGPFLWEHAPAAEDCMICHVPHGSNQPALLVRRAPQLCQGCHSSAGHRSFPQVAAQLPPGPASEFLIAQACLNCHTEVHGSNHPSGGRLRR